MSLLNSLRRRKWIFLTRRKITKQISFVGIREKLKIIIGSGSTHFNGWISTDLPHFNILVEKDWDRFFKNRKIDNLLAEHVLEHLTAQDVEKAIHLSHQYLKKGGVFRIAVPDGYNPDKQYQDDVSPSGQLGAHHGHLSLWNHELFENMATQNNFSCVLLEYFDKEGIHRLNPFNNENGYIERTMNNKESNYPSLVMDLIKR
jgi:predicted SAM-dependent methyltransferase